MENLSPTQKLKLIGQDSPGVHGTPIEIMQSAMFQHFEEDHVFATQTNKSFDDLQKLLESIDKKLTPISETYSAAAALGKWSMALLVAISLVAGIVYAVFEILIYFKK